MDEAHTQCFYFQFKLYYFWLKNFGFWKQSVRFQWPYMCSDIQRHGAINDHLSCQHEWYSDWIICTSSIQTPSQGATRLQEQGEMQRLRAQLQRAQDSLHAQELELERLRLLQHELGDSRKEQQVSCSAAAHASCQVEPDRVKEYANDAPILVSFDNGTWVHQ